MRLISVWYQVRLKGSALETANACSILSVIPLIKRESTASTGGGVRALQS
jgi:hypothetical protein